MPLKQEKEKIQNATNAKVQDVTIANFYLQVLLTGAKGKGEKGRAKREEQKGKSKGNLLGQSKGLTGAKGCL